MTLSCLCHAICTRTASRTGGKVLAFWTPPIFYLVGSFLSGSENRARSVLLWSMGAIPFVFLHTSIIWLLVRPYDSALLTLSDFLVALIVIASEGWGSLS